MPNTAEAALKLLGTMVMNGDRAPPIRARSGLCHNDGLHEQVYEDRRHHEQEADELPRIICSEAFALATLLQGLEASGYPVRGGTGAPSLYAWIGQELPRYLQEGRPPFTDWHNGAYALESLPCALWCFLASPDEFEQTLFTAVDAGHDADTVAVMASTLSGAYLGYSHLPQRLLGDLEYHDRLIESTPSSSGRWPGTSRSPAPSGSRPAGPPATWNLPRPCRAGGNSRR